MSRYPRRIHMGIHPFAGDIAFRLARSCSGYTVHWFPKTGSKVLHGGSFLSATGTILRCLFRGRYCYTPSGNSCWLELLHWNFCNFCNWTRGGVRLVVDVGRLPTLVTLLAQDRYYDADFLLGWVEVKVGGSMITICAILDFTRSGRAACLNGGTYLYRHPVPLTTWVTNYIFLSGRVGSPYLLSGFLYHHSSASSVILFRVTSLDCMSKK